MAATNASVQVIAVNGNSTDKVMTSTDKADENVMFASWRLTLEGSKLSVDRLPVLKYTGNKRRAYLMHVRKSTVEGSQGLLNERVAIKVKSILTHMEFVSKIQRCGISSGGSV